MNRVVTSYLLYGVCWCKIIMWGSPFSI